MPKAKKQNTTIRKPFLRQKRLPKNKPREGLAFINAAYQRKTAREPNLMRKLKMRKIPADGPELRLLPVQAFQQDSVILDNQDDHVVLTVRVPKAVIRDNIPLLMGLAERALGRD